MKKIITSVLVIGLFIGLLIVVAKTNPSPTGGAASVSSSGGTLVAQENAFDFGTVSMAAGKVSHTFEIKNTGAEAVTIAKLYTSCMCTSASLLYGGERIGPFGMPGHGFQPAIDVGVKPTETAEVEVVFDPAAHGPAGVGKIARTVYVENNAGEPVTLNFTAVVTP